MRKKRIAWLLCLCIVVGSVLGGCGDRSSQTISNVEEESDTDTTNESDTIVQTEEVENLSEDVGTETEEETVMEQTVQVRQGFMMTGTSITEETGIPEGAIPIRTIEDLKAIEERTKEHYILMNDIDLEGRSIRIKDAFAGIFDGNYHQIKNPGAAIFNSISQGGLVKNLAVIDTKSEKSGIADSLWSGTIYNCYVTGEIGKDLESSHYWRGGIVAEVMGEGTTISYCYNAADIYASADTTGGIAGRIMDNSRDENTFYIEFCENYGVITSTGGTSLGGICGEVEMDADSNRSNWQRGTIVRCVNYGTIQEIEDKVSGSDFEGLGGILGAVSVVGKYENMSMQFNIFECSNYGQISEYEGTYPNIGGICGDVWMEQRETTKVSIGFYDCLNVTEESAGICGKIDSDYGTVTFGTCIDLSGSKDPLYDKTYASYNHEPRINVYSCYYLSESEDTVRNGAEPLTPEQFKDEDFMWEKGMNFDGVWWMEETINNGYPHPTIVENLNF